MKFYPQFDAIVLLNAPANILIEQLATRTNIPYGKHPDEITAFLGYLETVESLLRQREGYEIDTHPPLDQVVETILRLACTPPE